MPLDHALRERLPHPIQIRPARGVLKARERRLGSEHRPGEGIAIDEELVDRIAPQPRCIIPIGVAAGDPKESLPQQIAHRVLDLALLPSIHQALRQALTQPQRRIAGLQQDRPAVGAGVLLIEPRQQRLGKQFRKQERLSWGIVSQVKEYDVTVLLYFKSLLSLMRS